MENKFEIKEMRECIDTLNKASAAYYNGGNTIMSDQEWDAMFDRLKKMEEETGIVYPDSPTHSVGAPVKVDELQIVKHEFPALSLDKTKDIQELSLPMIMGN